jgi:hypothetical protein
MHRSFVLALFSVGLMPIGGGRRRTRLLRHPMELATRFLPSASSARHRPPTPGQNGAPGSSRSAMDRLLRATFAVLTFGIGLAGVSSPVAGHHSLAMFDREHPIQLIGIVREFKFASPHAFIALEVTGKDARTVIWNLEGDSPNSLKWDGWSSQSLKSGDELRLTVEPLRNGAPGAAWHARNTTYKDGTPIVVIHEK